jgi:hypothetical protein
MAAGQQLVEIYWRIFAMSDLRKLEYYILRYVPDAARGEFVNIGLLMTEIGGDSGGFVGMHFTRDWRRARCHDAEIDIEMLEALGKDLQNRFVVLGQQPLMLEKMIDSYSNIVQLSEVQSCIAADPETALKDLASRLVESRQIGELVVGEGSAKIFEKTSGKRWIHARMTDEFKLLGVWDFLDKDLPVTAYTNEADDFTFDFAYNAADREIRLFHAVSLAERVKDAELFAYRVAQIGPAMTSRRKIPHRFTAVVEDSFDEADKKVVSVLAMMKAEEVRVARLQEMPTIALAAKQELGV